MVNKKASTSRLTEWSNWIGGTLLCLIYQQLCHLSLNSIVQARYETRPLLHPLKEVATFLVGVGRLKHRNPTEATLLS